MILYFHDAGNEPVFNLIELKSGFRHTSFNPRANKPIYAAF